MSFQTEWLAALEDRFGKVSSIHRIAAREDHGPEIVVFFFEGLPENLLTAVTCGLSSAPNPEWKLSKPELIITLDTNDKAWGLAAGYFASAFFTQKSFSYGDLFMFDTPVSEESEMTGFFLFAPSFLPPPEDRFELSDRVIHLVGMYPLYPSEIQLYQQIGLEKFWKREGFDMYDVQRQNLGA